MSRDRTHAALCTLLADRDTDDPDVLATEILAIIEGHGWRNYRDPVADDWRRRRTGRPATAEFAREFALIRARNAAGDSGTVS